MSEKQLALVDFETAKSLKELGFDWECSRWYCHKKGRIFCNCYPYNAPQNFNGGDYNNFSIPEGALVLKWMLEVKGILILSLPTVTMDWTFKIIMMTIPVEQPPYNGVAANDYSTKEDSDIAGVKAAIEYLKSNKK